MRRMRFLLGCLVLLIAVIGAAKRVRAAAIDELIANSKKEGTVEFLAPSSWPPKSVDALGEAFNKKYGINIKLRHNQ